MRFPIVVLLSACALMLAAPLLAQSPNGVLNGQVVDPSNGVIVGADVVAVNDVTGVLYTAKTNNEGIYVLQNLPPGPYRLQVSKIGFKTLIKPDITLNVQDALAINFTLPVGALSETVTVEGGAPLVNTESATVSTVVDRQFAENLPMNGRSFQTLIQLTPGVVLTPSTIYDSGQFSVNGQRANANYWMVDGVGANIGVGAVFTPRNGYSGSLASFSAQGGTNSLVSVDALQEFRIQTSTFAPEFGRMPGGQISIITRSGTNQFHGTAFDYLRNDLFDANDWFAASKGQPKPEERQNDFGGTFSGPLAKGRSFFFFSYEGLRLRLPQFAATTVPDLTTRQNAVAAMQPFLQAYPLPNGPEVVDQAQQPTGAAEFNSSFSDTSTLDAYSLRLDHRLAEKLSLFGRYNYSPSEVSQRGLGGNDYSLSTVFPARIVTQTATVGATWTLSPLVVNDFRFNYSRTKSATRVYIDDFGGAVPIHSLPFPAPYTNQNGNLYFNILSLANGTIDVGQNVQNLQRQINIVDDTSIQKGSHSIKLGIDVRRLSPVYNPAAYYQYAYFFDVSSAATGNLCCYQVLANRDAQLLFHNIGAFVQDTWKALPRLTLTYGIRWDVDLSPSSANGINLLAVTNFNDLSKLALAPNGTAPFRTPFGNIGPRLGLAYQVNQSQKWQAVVRGGVGLFFDLVTQEVGGAIAGNYPFGQFGPFNSGGTFPLSSEASAPPTISPDSLSSGTLYAFDPHLHLPYTLQGNVAIQQALGTHQTVTASYVGAAGRRLIQSSLILSPNPQFDSAYLVGNSATSSYNALQLQFQRRLERGLQAIVSYSWAHSIDTASAGSAFGNVANTFVPSESSKQNRGPSDFDIRNAFSAGLTYNVPTPNAISFAKAVLRDWSIHSIIQARGAVPVNVYDSAFFGLSNAYTTIRPDLIQGLPLYLYGPQYPGGKALNSTIDPSRPSCKGAFCPPPTDSNGNPLRQGNLGRNALRGFGATQWDLSVHREFLIYGGLKLQFRCELFNVLNHPNFAPPLADLSNSNFGRSTQMLGRSLGASNQGGGGFSQLYQIGGPRSVQFAIKLMF